MTDHPTDSPAPPLDLEASYPPCLELQALALTVEYCAVHSVTDPLRVRQVHCLALSIVLEESDA